MLRSFKHLWLGLSLITIASGILLWSDFDRRQKNRPTEQRIPRVAVFKFTSTTLIDDAVRGTVEGLAAAGYVDGQTIKLEHFNASGDYATANAIARDIVAGGYDQIITISTPALQVMAAANRDGKTPHVFGAVTDPYGSGVAITGSAPNQHPRHLVGIGTFQPVTSAFAIAQKMCPQLRRVGVVWNPTEHNSEVCVQKARAACKAQGLELVEANAGNTSEVPESLRSVLARDVDAIWIGGDTVAIASTGAIAAAAKASHIPVFTNDPSDVTRGALFSLGASYPDVGRTVASLSVRLLRGVDPLTIGVDNVVPERLTLSSGSFEGWKLPWQVPDEIRQRAAASPAAAVVTTSSIRTKPEPGRVYKVGILYSVPHKIFDEAIVGFRAAFAEAGFEEGRNLKLSVSHANGDMAIMQQMVANAANSDLDLIIPLSTPCLAAVCAKVKDKPVVFADVTEPVGAGAGKSFTNHQANVTGAVSPAPMEGGFTWLTKLYPKARKLGLLYNPGEANARTELEIVKRFMKARGIEVISRSISSSAEVPEALNSLLSEQPELFFLMADSTVASAQPVIIDTCRRQHIPVLADDDSCMGTGALIACGISPFGNGYFGGQKAVRVLLGENPATMPFEPSSKTDLALDLAAAKALNLTLPVALLKEANIFYHTASRLGRPARIALVNLVQTRDLDLAEQGLWRGLRESGLVEGTDYVVKRFNAQGEIGLLPQIFDTALATQPDLVLTITTPALVAGANKVTTVPLVFTVGSNPEKLGLFAKRRPTNLTGVHDDPPMAKLLAMATTYRPGLTTVGTVFNPAEANAVISVEKLRTACRDKNITLQEVTVSNVSELAQATQSIVQRGAQALFTSSDNLVNTGFPIFVRTARAGNVPVFTTDPSQMAQGATGACGDDFEAWGAQSGRLAAKILAGVSPSELPIETTAVQRTCAPVPAAPAATIAVPAAQPAAPTPPKRPWQLRIVAYNETTLSEECQQGLIDGLVRGGLVRDRDFELKTLNAQGDMTTLSSIMAAVRSDQPDLLLAITTPALQAALRQTGNLRIVFTGVADGVQAGAGKTETDHLPNVTGITTRSPFEGMAKLLREIFPTARRVGTLFTPAETNSLVYKKALEEALKPVGIELVCVPVTATAETVEATSALCREKIDAICQISDNTTRPGFGQIARKAADAGLPIFAFDTNQAKAGAMLALARDYYQAGFEAGEVAVRVLRGESPANIPFANTRSETLTINPVAAARVGLKFPASVTQNAQVFEAGSSTKKP